MKPSFEKSTITIGEIVAANVRRILSRHFPKVEWLELLQPVLQRLTSGLALETARFLRRDALPPAPWKQDLASMQVSVPDDDGQPLGCDVLDRLRGIVGPEANALRVHDDVESDAIARENHADAVTIGRDAFFRRGMYRPHQLPGFSLLTHEATHVVEAMRHGAAWRRATSAAAREEEQIASARERNVLLGAPKRSRPRTSQHNETVTAAAPLPLSSQNPILRPMKADVDRPLPDAGETAATNGINMDSVRRALFRDLMSQIKVEFERGA